jgi:hypothetical protein
VKSDSAVERGGSARRGRGGGGGRADMVARGGGKRGRLERKREGGRERIPLFFFLVSGVDFGLWRFFGLGEQTLTSAVSSSSPAPLQCVSLSFTRCFGVGEAGEERGKESKGVFSYVKRCKKV